MMTVSISKFSFVNFFQVEMFYNKFKVDFEKELENKAIQRGVKKHNVFLAFYLEIVYDVQTNCLHTRLPDSLREN